jgi:hypothetical protein
MPREESFVRDINWRRWTKFHVARLRNLLPRPARERVALQAHIPFREIWQTHRAAISSRRLLRSGSSERNRAQPLPRRHATHYFRTAAMGTSDTSKSRQSTLAHHHAAHTCAGPCAHENLLFIGDAAASWNRLPAKEFITQFAQGELAAGAIAKIIRGKIDN